MNLFTNLLLFEHYLLEQSIYGNIVDNFSKDYIYSNGSTFYKETSFSMSTVHDFKENFIKLLDIINKPIFEQEKIELVKNPIIQEIKKVKDRNGYIFDKETKKCLTKESYDDISGSINDVESMNVNDLKMFHKLFYIPSNQIIVITGNIDKDLINLIEEKYNEYNYEDIVKEEIFKKETDEVVTKLKKIKDGTIKDNMFKILYKINLKDFNNEMRNRLDYYISYLLSNFDDKSYVFDYLFNNGLVKYSIIRSAYFGLIKDYLVIYLGAYTDNIEEVVKILKDNLNTKLFSEDSFNKWKSTTIIDKMLTYENEKNITSDFVDNIFSYDLYKNDTIDFIKSLNYNECIEYINKLDFSNNSIIINEI